MLARAAPRSVSPLPDAADRITDAELVERARRDRDAWAEGVIYQRYARELANLAARLLRSRADALDVVQEVFVDTFEELDSLRDPSALRAWLRQRTVRRVHRIFRRRRLWRMLGLDHDEAGDGLDVFAHPGASPDTLTELARISQRLHALPDRQRIAWMLHHVEGETLPSVADACGVSLATVKRDIASAQRALGCAEDHE